MFERLYGTSFSNKIGALFFNRLERKVNKNGILAYFCCCVLFPLFWSDVSKEQY